MVNIWRCFVAKEPIVNLRFTSGSSKKVVYLFLTQEVKFQGKKERGIRKRHSSGELESKSRGTQNIPPKKRDKVFDKIDVKDRKEKFLNLENKAKKVSWVDPNNFNILKFCRLLGTLTRAHNIVACYMVIMALMSFFGHLVDV